MKHFTKVLTTVLMVVGMAAMPLFSKYEIGFKLDKVFNEAEIDNVMKPTEANTFADDWFNIVWTPTPKGFDFVMENKANKTLTIVWDESNFINEKGESGKVFHSEVKFINKDESISPTNIPIFAKINDILLPVEYWYFGTAKKIGWGSAVKQWRNIPIWDTKIKDSEFEALRGKDITLRVILCVRKGDEKRIYHFFFNAVGKKI